MTDKPMGLAPIGRRSAKIGGQESESPVCRIDTAAATGQRRVLRRNFQFALIKDRLARRETDRKFDREVLFVDSRLTDRDACRLITSLECPDARRAGFDRC